METGELGLKRGIGTGARSAVDKVKGKATGGRIDVVDMDMVALAVADK